MPYIITTTIPMSEQHHYDITRHAVATLDGAQHLAFCSVDRATGKPCRSMNSDEQRVDRGFRLAVRFDLDHGGTVGPLPDGTVITVARINGYTLAGVVANAMDEPCRVADAVASYNAAQH